MENSLKSFLLGMVFTFVSSQCPEPNGLFGVAQHCDRYVECRNGTLQEHLCPDGLVFNANLNHFRYACDYPTDVDCSDRPQTQAATPTTHCPHLWGLFPDQTPNNCGVFWNCVDGASYRFDCPEGLAFSTATSRCDYPDETPNCDAQNYLGFNCPEVDPAILQTFLGNPRFSHPVDCKKFFVCIEGTKPRLQNCPDKQVFNQGLGACDDPLNVKGCENYYGGELIDARSNIGKRL